MAEGPRRAQGMATCLYPQIILMLREKCLEHQKGRAEAEQLCLLLSPLEQSLKQLQKDKEALRCVAHRGASGGSRQGPIPVWPHDTGQ